MRIFKGKNGKRVKEIKDKKGNIIAIYNDENELIGLTPQMGWDGRIELNIDEDFNEKQLEVIKRDVGYIPGKIVYNVYDKKIRVSENPLDEYPDTCLDEKSLQKIDEYGTGPDDFNRNVVERAYREMIDKDIPFDYDNKSEDMKILKLKLGFKVDM